MACTLIETRSIGAHMLGAIEKIYRCDNGFGAVVVQDPPGGDNAGLTTVTPIQFHGDGADDYEICSSERAVEGLDREEILRPQVLTSDEDVEIFLELIGTLPPDTPTDRD
jgi:hypothetical protein